MNPSIGSPATTLDDILITPELARRTSHAPDFEAEGRVLVALARVMAESPESVLQVLCDRALELCHAGSAGVSVWDDAGPEAVFRWQATAGDYAPYVGGTMPGQFSPCGVVLERNAPLLMANPHRFFPYIANLCSPAREVLLVPFHQGGIVIGTVWVVAHSPDRHFDSEDARLVASLTQFAGAAVQMLNRVAATEAAEQSLLESENRFRALVTATSDVVYRMNADWTEMRQLVGREFIMDTREPSRSWLDVYIPAEERPRVTRAVQEAIRARHKFELEHRVVRLDGTIGWTFSRAIPILDDAGHIVEWFGTATDITERRRTEAESTHLAVTLGLAMEAGKLGFWEWDPTIDRATLSAQAREIFGVPDEASYGHEDLRSLLHPDDRQRARDTVARAVAARKDYDIEYRLNPREGESRWIAVRGRGIYDDDGHLLRMHGVVQDVHERREVEEGLRQQSDRMRLLWEAAAVLLTTEEPDSMIRRLFSKIAPHFGLDTYFNFMVDESGQFLRLESCAGIPDVVANSIRRLEFGQAICGAVAVSREPITATCIQQSDDPRVQLVKGFGIQVYACNPLLAGDRLLGTLSFASRTRETFDPDELEFLKTICHYVTAAYDRLRLIRQLRDADRKKDDFIALLAHELRNPLAPIRNGLQVIRLADNDRDTLAWAREMMDRQLSHMVRLIDDLLDMSRINRNKMELRRARVSLTEVVASAVETARPQLDAAGHELIIALPAAVVILDADLTRLAQVFSNLLTNSAKYTPAGGRIWLSAERANGQIVVSVRDTGIGIPANAHPTIFDMFSQVDRTVERNSGGLGIGLALVKGLVEMHGGTVAVASDGEGEGTTFTVTLPEAERSASDEAALSEVSVPGGSRRILIVDDSHDGARSLAEMLRRLGNEVDTAHDGLAAVATAETFRPDVILMDVGMPLLNGLDATRRIRQQPWGRAVRIVALTGWGQENDRERSRAAGCDGHLVKPVELTDLQKMLRHLEV